MYTEKIKKRKKKEKEKAKRKWYRQRSSFNRGRKKPKKHVPKLPTPCKSQNLA